MAARAVKEAHAGNCLNGRSWPGSQADTVVSQFAWCVLAFDMGARFKRQFSLGSACF